jgi:hypothetical protein
MMNFRLSGITFLAIGAVLFGTPSADAGNPNLDDFLFPSKAVRGRDGNFYTVGDGGPGFGGTVYRIKPTGQIRSVSNFLGFLRSFPGYAPWGASPSQNVSVGSDGAIYAVAQQGGVFGGGVIYKVETSGRATPLHHLSRGTYTLNSVFLGTDFYESHGNGFVTRLSRDGRYKTFQIPQNETGDLAVTTTGELLLSCSTGYPLVSSIWRLNAQDEFEFAVSVPSHLYQLNAVAGGGIIALGENSVFRVAADNTVSTVHTFSSPAGGQYPYALFPCDNGDFYGTTFNGGADNRGVFFRVGIVPGTFQIVKHLDANPTEREGVRFLRQVFPTWMLTAGGNRQPVAKDEVVAATSLKVRDGSRGLPQVEIDFLKNDSDADLDPLTISYLSTPAHGTTNLIDGGRRLVYTANSSQVANDAFSYRVSDGRGGKATAWIFIRTSPKGSYEGAVKTVPNSIAGDPGTEVGSISLLVSAGRQVSGRVQLYGRTHVFTTIFNEVNQCAKVLSFQAKTGDFTSIQLLLRPSGAQWFVEAQLIRNYASSAATCLPSK